MAELVVTVYRPWLGPVFGRWTLKIKDAARFFTQRHGEGWVFESTPSDRPGVCVMSRVDHRFRNRWNDRPHEAHRYTAVLHVEDLR